MLLSLCSVRVCSKSQQGACGKRAWAFQGAPPGRRGSGSPGEGGSGWAALAFLTGASGISYQLGPVHDVLPGEVLAGELLFKLPFSHLGHQEVGLAHQGSEHIGDAPRARQDQPRGSVLLHSPGYPLGVGAGRTEWTPTQLWVPRCVHEWCPSPPTSSHPGGRALLEPPGGLPYLQGAGVAVDQQTEHGDLDAACACGWSACEALPGG